MMMSNRKFRVIAVAAAIAISISMVLLAIFITRQVNERNAVAHITARGGRIELHTEMPTWTVHTQDAQAHVGLGNPPRRRAWMFDTAEKGRPVLVDLSQIEIDEDIAQALSAMPRLEGVVMRDAKIKKHCFLKFIRDHGELRCLDLSGTSLSVQEIEEGIRISGLHYVAVSSDSWKSPRSLVNRDGVECEVLVTAAD
jgi:hypothetical protein